VLLLRRPQLEALLDWRALEEAVARSMVSVSLGTVSMPSRIAAVVEREGRSSSFLAAMPAYLPAPEDIAAVKLVTVFPDNGARGRPTHQALVAVFDPEDGSPLALLDGTFLTEARTAAGSALATRLLAKSDAKVLAVLGAGAQARSHLEAVSGVRAFREIRIANRSAPRAEALAREVGPRHGGRVRVVSGFDEALRGADVVCATTASDEPVVRREWLSPGVHVNSVGWHVYGREVDAATVAEARVVVESRSAALAPSPAGSNDLTAPLRDGLVRPDFVHAEIGELVAGLRPGRTDANQITLYKSVGVAAQDAAAAGLMLALARRSGLGEEIAI
jgi:ornithine cyclodeaminase